MVMSVHLLVFEVISVKKLIIGLNAKFIHPAVAVYSLQDYAARFGVETDIKEFSINQSYDEIYYTILSQKADLVAFSVYIWNVELVARILKDIRKAVPSVRLVLGGPEVSYGLPLSVAEADYDFCLSGEGERVFTALCLSLENRPVPTEWAFHKEGKNCFCASIKDLDELPFIYGSRMDAFRNRIIYYEASRGCPFHCSYCLSAAEEGLRLKSPQKVLEELAFLVANGATLIKFLDRSFNARIDSALAILRYIASIPLDNPIRFHFELEADTLSETLIEAFQAMPRGRVQLEIGIQSTHPATLKAVHRNPSVERLFDNIRALGKNRNLKIHVDLIAGLPYETIREFKKSFNDVFSLYADELQLGFLKRLTGAPLATEDGLGNLFSSSAPYEILKNDFLSVEDLAHLKQIEDVLDRFYNSGRFRSFFRCIGDGDAWAFFEKLAAFVKNKSLAFQPLGVMEEFGLLSEFAPHLRIALLRDFYAFTSSDQLPESLADIARKPQNAAETATALLKQAGHRELRLMCRFVDGVACLYDYTEKDAVTESYSEWPLSQSDKNCKITYYC